MAVTGAGGAAMPPARAALLEAASECFARSGFQGTRLVDIAARAGLTTGAFYGHFASKAGAFHVLFDQYVDALDAALAEAESFTDFCRRWLAVSAGHCGAIAAGEEITGEDPQFRASRETCRSRWAEQAASHLPLSVDPEVRRVTANLVVDTLDRYWLSVMRGWTPVEPEMIVTTLEVMVHSGLYADRPAAASGGFVSPEREVPSERPLWHWEPAPGRVEPRTARGHKQREAVLEAATEVFAAQGLQNATVGLVAERAGVSPATVYRYFTDKTDIFFCLLGRIDDTVHDVIYEHARFPLDANGRLDMRETTIETFALRQRFAAVYRVWWEMAWAGGAMEDAWLSLRREWQESLTPAIAHGRAAGLFNDGLDDRAIAEIAVDAAEGVGRTHFDLGWDTDTSNEQLVDVFAALLGTGICVGSATQSQCSGRARARASSAYFR